MFSVIETTVALGRYELALVASRDELAQPSRVFAPRRV
jgi:pyridoxal/pyridoxine/pyridoxamine kinase